MSTLFSRLFRRHVSTAQIPSRDEFLALANSAEVATLTEQMLAQIPLDDAFESFAETKSRRNALGIVPLKD